MQRNVQRYYVVIFYVSFSCIASSGNPIQCKQVISQLPTPHKNVFDYLTGKYSVSTTWMKYLVKYIITIHHNSPRHSQSIYFCLFQHFYEKSFHILLKTGRIQLFSQLFSAQCSWGILLTRDMGRAWADTLISRIIRRRRQHFCTIFWWMSPMIEDWLLISVIGDKFFSLSVVACWQVLKMWSIWFVTLPLLWPFWVSMIGIMIRKLNAKEIVSTNLYFWPSSSIKRILCHSQWMCNVIYALFLSLVPQL